MENKDKKTEEFSVKGSEVVDRVKKIIEEGNTRRVVIKNEKGETLLVIPVTVGVVGAVLLPVYAALGALAALLTKCTIVVEKKK